MIRASAKRKTPINRGFFSGSNIQKESKKNIATTYMKKREKLITIYLIGCYTLLHRSF